MNRLAAPLYVTALALLAAALAALWLAPGPLAGWRHWQAPPPQAPNLDDVPAALLRANPAAAATYPAVLRRPLFSPTRQPQAGATAGSAAAPAPAPNAIDKIKLQGVVVGPTLAGVMLDDDGQARFVRPGERVGDWTLARIQGRRAVFSRRGQERTLDWPAPGAAEPAAAKAATPARVGAAPEATRAPANSAGVAATPPTAAGAAPSTARQPGPSTGPAPVANTPPGPSASTTAAPDASTRPRGSFGGGGSQRPPANSGANR